MRKRRKLTTSWLLLLTMFVYILSGSITVFADEDPPPVSSESMLIVRHTPESPVTSYSLQEQYDLENAVMEFDFIPLDDNVNGVIAYSGDGKQFYWSASRVIEVVLQNGVFKARNGGNVEADKEIYYQKDQTYHIKVEPTSVDTSGNIATYSVWVDGELLAENYAVRTNQKIKHIGAIGVISSGGSFMVRNHNKTILGSVDNMENLDEPNNPEPNGDGTFTYRVGPTHKFKKLQDVMGLMQAGDTILVDGDVVYPGGLVFPGDTNTGVEDMPITIRGITVNGRKPVLRSDLAQNIVQISGNYIIFDNFEIAGNANLSLPSGYNVVTRGVFHVGHETVLRNLSVHDCRHGILGADDGAGSITIEYCDIYDNGVGGGTYHNLYLTTDEHKYPDAVARIQFNYIHDSKDGNGLKTRARRNEIYYNWFENNYTQALELVSPVDENETGDNDSLPIREDSDVVGNVIISRYGSLVRVGGDGTGQGTCGRYRFVNNTFIHNATSGNPRAIRLAFGVESLECYNNIFYMTRGIVVDRSELTGDERIGWLYGSDNIQGSNNWVSYECDPEYVPSEWTNTIRGEQGEDPGFVDLANQDYRLRADSPLAGAGTMNTLATWPEWWLPSFPAGTPAFATDPEYAQYLDTQFPNPQMYPEKLPVNKNDFATGEINIVDRDAATAVDIGAYPCISTEPPVPEDDLLNGTVTVQSIDGQPAVRKYFDLDKAYTGVVNIEYTLTTTKLNGIDDEGQLANLYAFAGFYPAGTSDQSMYPIYNSAFERRVALAAREFFMPINVFGRTDYKAEVEFSTEELKSYQIKFRVDIPNQHYRVWIDGVEVTDESDDYRIATERHENPNDTETPIKPLPPYNDVGRVVFAAECGSFTISNFSISSEETEPEAQTYYVGPDREYKHLHEVANLLNPGDTVLIDGDHTYEYAYMTELTRSGTREKPITIRGVTINGKKPVLKGTSHRHVLVVAGDNYVIENLEISGNLGDVIDEFNAMPFFQDTVITYENLGSLYNQTGGENNKRLRDEMVPKVTFMGIRYDGDNTVIRNCVVHDCRQGILGNDIGSGSILIEYCEFYHNGAKNGDHNLYLACDESEHPDAVARVHFCYIHDSLTGNGLKSRAARNEIYYNWFENNRQNALELCGPDPGWNESETNPVYTTLNALKAKNPDYDAEDEVREDSDIVGNVIITRGSTLIRIGGDGTGQTWGRYRIVNNTLINMHENCPDEPEITDPEDHEFDPDWNKCQAIRMNSGVESVEMFNNVFYNDKGLMHVFYVENDPQWADVLGMWASHERMVKGSNNWVRKLENEGTFSEVGAISVPEEWTNTFEGTDPGFASLENRDFTLLPTSILAGNGTFDTAAEWEDWTAEWEVTRTWTKPPIEECTGRQKAFYSNTDNAFPNPLMTPEYLPVRRNALDKEDRIEASGISIGAYPATEVITPSEQVLYVNTTPGAPVTTYEFETKRTGDNIEISYTVIPLTDSIDGSISYNQSAENMWGPRGYGKSFAFSDSRVISLRFNTDGTATLTDYTGKKNNSRNLSVACNVKPIPDFTYSKDTPIEVRYVINLSTQTYDAYIDGRKVAEGYKIGGSIGNDGSFVEYLKDIGCIGVVAFEGRFKIVNHSEKLLRVVDNELNLDEPNNPAIVDGVRTFYVGPTHKFKKLQDVVNLLEAGDLVLVDGDVEYPDNVRLFKHGTEENPIIIRGVIINGRRPVIKNATGYRGILVEGNYNIIENFEVAGNPKVTNGGIFHVAHGTVIRNCYVHDTYGDGILGSDETGSLTIEFTEVARAGNTYDHAIYIGMNEILYPDGVLNVRYCYIHESMTATGIKSRAPRNNIYYNWVEDTKNRCLELSGPDMDFMADRRAAAERGEADEAYLLYDDELMREDSDIVGNVFIENDRNTNDIARIGGDGSGRTYGRFRFVNNTFVNLKTTPNSNAIKVNFGIESVEMYNNVFYSPYAPMRIFYPSDDGDSGVGSPEGAWSCTWASGERLVQGSNNWVSEGSLLVPEEWTDTIVGTDPGFVDAENFNFRLKADSPLRGAGTKNTVATWEDWGENEIDERKDNGKIIHLVCQDTQFPNPLLLPEYMAVDKADFIANREIVPIPRDNTVMDIGAYSYRAEGQPVVMPLTLNVETSGTGVTVYSYSVNVTEGIDPEDQYHGDYYVVIQVYHKDEPALTYAQKFNTENNANNCMFKLGSNARVKMMVVTKFDESDDNVIVLADAVEIQ